MGRGAISVTPLRSADLPEPEACWWIRPHTPETTPQNDPFPVCRLPYFRFWAEAYRGIFLAPQAGGELLV